MEGFLFSLESPFLKTGKHVVIEKLDSDGLGSDPAFSSNWLCKFLQVILILCASAS